MTNHHLETYTTDDIILETDCDIARFVKPSNMSLIQFGNDVWLKALGCRHRYGICVLKGIFVKSLREQMRSHWSSHKTDPLKKLAYHATWLTNLQAARTHREQPHTHTNSQGESNNRQYDPYGGMITKIGSSGNTSPRRSGSRSGRKLLQ